MLATRASRLVPRSQHPNWLGEEYTLYLIETSGFWVAGAMQIPWAE